MEQKANKYAYRIVLPTIVAIALFIVSFYVIIIPLFEQSMMDRKKEMILELTNAAWSVLDEYNDSFKDSTVTLKEAQSMAAEQIGKMRYGNEQKDYFWIISSGPEMVMHPYRPELIGRDLSNYTDNHENKLFVDAAQLVQKEGEGMIEYYWQWKDDASRVVPKLSYVKGFDDWNWIIGTGIYLEDVRLEIKQLKRDLFKISFIIILIIVIILFYVLRQAKLIEENRKSAELKLKLSVQKYKSLVEASTEGTLMVVDGNIIYANFKFVNLLNNEELEIINKPFSDLFEDDWEALISKIDNPKKSYFFETKLLNAKPGLNHVIVYVSQITYSGQLGHIVVVKKITEKKRLRLDAQKFSEDIQLSLQLMNQPVLNLVKENVYCNLNDTIKDVAVKMSDKQTKLVCVKNNEDVIGVVSDTDFKNRVLAKELPLESPVASIMSSPVKKINQKALIYEAILLFRKNNVSHLLVENEHNWIIGNIGYQQCLEMQRNSLSYLVQEINRCKLTEDLKIIYNRLPRLIQAVFTSTDNINSVSRIITSIADAITTRLIELAINELGQPPCDFAFIAMGSEGRGEQTLKTDQDNAIIFDIDTDENKDYFLNLSVIINEKLHEIGYSRCKGDLMAGNPEWCNSLETWKQYFSDWTDKPEISNVLDSTIFFDLRLVYGNEKLVTDLLNHVDVCLFNNEVFFNQLVKTIIRKKVVIEKRHIDIKKFLLPIIGYLRIYALKYSVRETNSLLRLNKLIARGIISEPKGEEIEKIYNFLMHQRIKWQVELILDNDTPDNNILLKNLSSIEQATLKNIQKEITKLQNELQAGFKVVE